MGENRPAIAALREAVDLFADGRPDARAQRNEIIGRMRNVLQRVAIRNLRPDLLILDEVQRFREVLDQAQNPSHIASELFGGRVPVLILSATPYRALTLGHELGEGAAAHHEDFHKTLDFLFDRDKETPARIRRHFAEFGKRLAKPELIQMLDPDLLRLKRALEDDLTRVISRTERNWYVLDRRKGVDDTAMHRSDLPSRDELTEYFRLHNDLSTEFGMAQVTEFWKSAPSLLTFLDGKYALVKKLTSSNTKVSRHLLTPAGSVDTLSRRNHRISKVVDVALGPEGAGPKLWTSPTYTYYEDKFFGSAPPRKLLVFSGWRFVPKVVAIVASQVAAQRYGGDPEDPRQPLRFTEKRSFHVFDACFPSLELARLGGEAYRLARPQAQHTAEAVVENARLLLTDRCQELGIEIDPESSDPAWQVAFRLEAKSDPGRAALIRNSFAQWAGREGEANASEHAKWIADWLSPDGQRLRISTRRLQRMALSAAFSPANCVLRALESVYGAQTSESAYAGIVALCLGPLRRYFNKPHVQQIIREHRIRMRWQSIGGLGERGYAERVLSYAGDAHFQAVMDEYVYLQSQGPRRDADDEPIHDALERLGDIWGLARGTPRTNGAGGHGLRVSLRTEANVHATHFAIGFGDEEAQGSERGPDAAEEGQRIRKSVVREAFNSPFWPFVLATTSVGQEGLDFHLYCRDILHWNLPSNPVDFEQREGRINRRGCLAVRESIARDWPLTAIGPQNGDASEVARNPWLDVFKCIDTEAGPQKYKHGLFPHWVYECRRPNDTVRIQRHVPFFATSRDASRYERLKSGLALYRLVFGQANQEDLLENLERQVAGLSEAERDKVFRRLAAYMLNLSPIGLRHAKEHAREEAREILADASGALWKRLETDITQLLTDPMDQLGPVKSEVAALMSHIAAGIGGRRGSQSGVEQAVAALAYVRNPYDGVFDHHVEGGYSDDIEVVKEAFRALPRSARRGADPTLTIVRT